MRRGEGERGREGGRRGRDRAKERTRERARMQERTVLVSSYIELRVGWI